MTSRNKPVGPRVFCPRCKSRCWVQVTKLVHEWQADGVAICSDLECGYSATVGLFYEVPGEKPLRTERRPVTIEDNETRKDLELQCPQCQGPGRIRTSGDESPFLRFLYIFCDSCDFKGKAYVAHLELLNKPSGAVMQDLPLHPRLREAYQREFGHDPDGWRNYGNDGTRKRNARLAGVARAGH